MQLGAQSYTIREFTQNEADFARSMKKVADIGYTTIQLSAVGDLKPTFMKQACDDNNLKIVLTHTNPDRMLKDPEGVIEDHNILGCQYIGIGMMPERYRSPEAVAGFADEFLRAAELFHKAGKKMMYHHHAMEWERVTPDKTMLDVILEKMPQEVLGITLDTYWVQAAGADVCDTIQALKDRIPCVHLKDMAIKGFEQRMAVVGEGNLPFNKILNLLKAQGTTKYLLVEQDNSYGEDPFACLKRSYEFLKGEGYQ